MIIINRTSPYNKISAVSFKESTDKNSVSIPNFKEIDEYVSRGAQPKNESQFKWLKEQGYGVVINFRTLFVRGLKFDEKQIVENLGMNYDNIPIISADGPLKEDIRKFFNIIKIAKKTGKKVFIHCMAGQDRTGIMSALYKIKNNLDSVDNCIREMLDMGHHDRMFPDLIPQLREYAQKY
ncbi:MAG: dual specificity protein phosphatase family protein [Candidatus Gastranaerophilales bacterium]|nr:dual specificity protein phosphatase family protein [Candidatus Gastranaerophilales bacterium]